MTAEALAQIPWDQPVLPPVDDAAWADECKRAMGGMPRLQRYIAPLPWLRRLALDGQRVRYRDTPRRLLGLAYLITSHENACRYCLGVAHAQMRLLGFDEDYLQKIERDAQAAGGDPAERAMMKFCRTLARSNPRPARADCEALERLGFSRRAVREVAFAVAMTCFANRVATFLAIPIEQEMEAMVESRMVRLLRPMVAWMDGKKVRLLPDRPSPPVQGSAYGDVVELIEDAGGAWPLFEGLQGAFGSGVLPARTKAWMFAVVARSLRCDLCSRLSHARLLSDGLRPADVEQVLTTLASPVLDARETILLPWTRETVHYRTQVMQQRTRELARQLEPLELLEAIGIAALANGCVRLAMLSQ